MEEAAGGFGKQTSSTKDMRKWFNKSYNREFLRASWEVKKLCVAGRWREAVLLHHAQKSGSEAGYSMDYYLETHGGTRRVNVRLVRKALDAMTQMERVSRLMYRANLLEFQGLKRILDVNEKNREKLNQHVDMDIVEVLSGNKNTMI